ncbi:MAG TPA: class I SAM-dependent methyltransferase, partial [Methanoregulaceae archaeon]|nr:class I SAM-dependent methyltransferase [Methanoregulaceae archaeon]
MGEETLLDREEAEAATVLQDRRLAERVEVRMQDYRDERGVYDGVASIEMFEAVGEAYWPAYFAQVRDRLVSGGRAALQIITIDEEIFPRYRRELDSSVATYSPAACCPRAPSWRSSAR